MELLIGYFGKDKTSRRHYLKILSFLYLHTGLLTLGRILSDQLKKFLFIKNINVSIS